ncbi:hypothetical protein HCA64_06405 [Listeria booriae]|uniref:Uncharacterized protein n=1 Tax=Listeria booriae TaxID=1552123 RepID=A0A099WCD6_9LIST|nr:hypothetical protein [Listeria booriae]KGL42677.1 hypothetical protein EP57_04245 [Listeria booriae]MBC1906101.1 hypothetical protein [Listeria booriae]STY40911.1 Uncharacterised protein [Listeria booriae]
MARINDAFVTGIGKMTLEEIALHEDFNLIKNRLICSTKNCDSRLTFASRKELNYLRTYRGDNHSEDCILNFDREELKRKGEKIAEIEGGLTRAKLKSRNKDFFKKLYIPTRATDTTKGKNANQIKSDSKNPRNYIDAKLNTDGTGDVLTETEQNGTRVRSPRINSRELNQISEKDVGQIIKANGYISEISLTDNNSAKVYVKFNNSRAVYILPPSFFSDEITANQINDYLRVMHTYIARKERKKLQIITLCEVKKIAHKNEIQELYINSYNWIDLAIETEPPKFLDLPNFVAQVVTKVF